LVSEIFDFKVADPQTNKQTHPQNSTLSDNKGPLKLSARKPTDSVKRPTMWMNSERKVSFKTAQVKKRKNSDCMFQFS